MTDIAPNILAQKTTSKRHPLRVAAWLGFGFVIMLIISGGLRFLANAKAANALQQHTQENLIRNVNVTHPKTDKLKTTLMLPASLRGYSESVVFSRSNGYLSAWYKTIGDTVKKGELLAKLETPEQTQELAQATASRELAKTRLALAKLTQERWQTLRDHDSVPQQELEEKRSIYQQALNELTMVEANINRLEQLQSFRHIVAPFSGVITRRSIDIGDLITPNSKELFALTQIDKLRLSLWVPQVYASEIKSNQEVDVSVSGLSEKFKGRIEHLSGAIDPVTRSRQIEIVLDNPDRKLIPGAYAEVSINLVKAIPAQIIPPSALVISKNDPYVVIVDKENKVRFQTVKIGRDLGKTIEIIDGVSPGDTLILSPSELLEEGEKVIPTFITLKDPDDKSQKKVADNINKQDGKNIVEKNVSNQKSTKTEKTPSPDGTAKP